MAFKWPPACPLYVCEEEPPSPQKLKKIYFLAGTINIMACQPKLMWHLAQPPGKKHRKHLASQHAK